MKKFETVVLRADFWNLTYEIHYYATDEIVTINELEERHNGNIEDGKSVFVEIYNSLNIKGFRMIHNEKIKDGRIYHFERET